MYLKEILKMDKEVEEWKENSHGSDQIPSSLSLLVQSRIEAEKLNVTYFQ